MKPAAPEAVPVPMLVLTRLQDHVEAINQTLRRAGHAVHCTWLPDARDLVDALIQINPELLVVFADEGLLPLEALGELRARTQPPVPVLVVSQDVSEASMTTALRAGAQEVVSLANPERLQLVCARELRAFRLERALNSTLSSAREYQRELAAFMQGSADAIAQVADGIVVDANPAWLELYGYSEADAIRGQPLMDLFDAESHAALKGGLAACLTGKWSDHRLRVTAQLADGTHLPLEMTLSQGEFDGEPVVRFVVPSRRHDEDEIQRRLADAVRTDPATGLLHRRYFVEQLRARLAEPVKGGVRYLASIRLDRLDQLVGQVGPLNAEELVAQFATVVRAESAPGDLAGRFTSGSLMFLIERGTQRDVEAWAEHIVRKVHGSTLKVESRTLPATATVGLGVVPASVQDPAGPVADAVEAARKGTEKGGNQVYTVGRADSDTRVQAYDKIWVRHIKAALMENRFRLVQQPIASLLGEDKGMFDVLVRMLDEQGKEVLPSEFIPAAERNDLMKNIDRWVIGASMSFCAARKPAGIFVRLSKDTVNDKSLPIWLSNQLKASRVDPSRLCFQVGQDVIEQHLDGARELRDHCKRQGFRFAIEHFGGGADPQQLVGHLKPDVVKIDGTLMQGLASNNVLQQKVKGLVQVAKGVGAQTIAERVEDANTMAVLWQLGIEFIQGYFVHKPEEVVLG
ncbi:MAG: EAL domain-containing protein [Proteobacteria bacterium]|nr:EAL domain-containing protein [Pseudomonadota bacterium]